MTGRRQIETFDKASWHFGGDFPDDLDDFQGYVHIGIYLAWIIDVGLGHEWLMEMPEVQLYLSGELTGPELLERLDGALNSEMLSPRGLEFTRDFYNAQGFSDVYVSTLAEDLESVYHVQDTRAAYEAMKVVLDGEYQIWKLLNP